MHHICGWLGIVYPSRSSHLKIHLSGTPMNSIMFPLGPKIETYNAMATACLRCQGAERIQLGSWEEMKKCWAKPRTIKNLGTQMYATYYSFFFLNMFLRIYKQFSEVFFFSFPIPLMIYQRYLVDMIFWLYQRYSLSHTGGVFLNKDFWGLFGVFGRFFWAFGVYRNMDDI